MKKKRRKPETKKPRAAKKPRAPARKRAPARRRAPTVMPTGASEPVGVAEQEALRAKFELGPHEWTQLLDAREKAQTIPWGYGRDRVTAMAIDPERLFVYWEVTDDGIARARAELGRAGEDAWLDLRIYDVTNVLFDGDNAHHHLDVGVARSDRQWFLQIGRPTSTAVVELGLLARDGSFGKIARSRRVDFPRREPLPRDPDHPAEWLTVRELPASAKKPHAPAIEIRGRRGRPAPKLLARADLKRSRRDAAGTIPNRAGSTRDASARAGAKGRGAGEKNADRAASRSAAGSEARLTSSLDRPSSPSARRGSPPGASPKS